MAQVGTASRHGQDPELALWHTQNAVHRVPWGDSGGCGLTRREPRSWGNYPPHMHNSRIPIQTRLEDEHNEPGTD